MLAHLRIFVDQESVRQELVALEVAAAGIDIMMPKARCYCIKLYDVAPQDALIIKQEMLSIGGEAAISQHAMPPHVKNGAVLVMGTSLQINRLAEKLTRQYSRAHGLGQALLAAMANVHKTYSLPLGKGVDTNRRTVIMGVINATPDSFYPGSRVETTEQAVQRASEMEAQGADIIDVGGASTRPGARAVDPSEEIARVVPIIKAIDAACTVPISVDTTSAEVASEALAAGACMVNDVTALQGDSHMASIIGEHEVPVCLMHMQGTPQTMQQNPTYTDVMADIVAFLHQRALYAMDQGIAPECIILDPGIGFGKRTGRSIEDNCTILTRLLELKSLGFPVLVGVSRKSFIGNLGDYPLEDRLAGSLGGGAMAIAHGADILRVHDVAATRQMASVVDAVARPVNPVKRGAHDLE
jgi:dihydropteroate synthase